MKRGTLKLWRASNVLEIRKGKGIKRRIIRYFPPVSKLERKIQNLGISFLKCFTCFPQPPHVMYYILLNGVLVLLFLVNIPWLLRDLSVFQGMLELEFVPTFWSWLCTWLWNLAFSEYQVDSLQSIILNVFIPWRTADT